MVKLKLTDTQLAVLYEIMKYVRLGDKNPYTTAISNLAIDMEEDGVAEYVEGITPIVSFSFTEADGMVIELD